MRRAAINLQPTLPTGCRLSVMLRPAAATSSTALARALNCLAPTLCATQRRFGSTRHKVLSVEDAVHLVPSGATVTVGGFVAQNSPEEVLQALGERFRTTGEPRDLTLIFMGGPGDWDKKGLNHFAQKGMIKRAIGSHYGQVPMLGKMAQTGEIEAYNFPMGTVSRMVRAAGSGSPGHITRIGYGTFVDPKNGGGKINGNTKEDLVQEIDLLGEKYLFFKAIPIDVAIIRGTTADADGNITMERESLYVDNMIQAMAARSRRGVVIAQVERVAANGSLNPRSVKIPGTMVDCVVVAKPENHFMSYVTPQNPAATALIRRAPELTAMPLDERKVIARRAALEIAPNQVVNLGIGMPEGVALVADEEGILSSFELTTEPGVHGGVGLSGHDFGPAVNYDALIEQNQQFDFYNGGGLDVCFLGMAEVDPAGNVNVTRVGNKLTGPGGFVDISQSTKRVNLLGTLTASNADYEVGDGKIKIAREGRIKKFVKSVKEITFSAETAVRNGQIVNYITERAVFHLSPKHGLELIEIAPGVDLQKDILDQMEFKPYIRPNLKTMDERIFRKGLMKLRDSIYGLSLSERLLANVDSKTLYINLTNMSITTREQIEEIERGTSEYIVAHFGTEKVDAIVNYEGFDCRKELNDDFVEMTKRLEAKHYKSAKRFTSHRAFTRHKLASMMEVGTLKRVVGEDEEIDFVEAQQKIRQLGLMVSTAAFQTYWNHYDTKNCGTISSTQFGKMLDQLNNLKD